MKIIRGNTNCIHTLQSLLLLLPQVCVLMRFQNQQAIVVESWSPTALPFTTSAHHNAVIHKGRNSNIPFLFSAPSFLAAANSGDDQESESDDEPQFIEVESLSASQVTELIELSFFQACFALSKGDVEPLKLFIVAVVTASKKYRGASAKALALMVDSLPPTMRPLEPQEREIRENWIQAVFLMMGHVLEGFESNLDETDEVTQTYGPILVDLVAIHRTGMGLNVNQFVASRRDELLPKKNVLALDDEDEDLVQLSIVTQTINVLYTTLVVLDEEYESSSERTEEEELKPAEPTSPTKKKSKKKGKNTGSDGGRGFG